MHFNWWVLFQCMEYKWTSKRSQTFCFCSFFKVLAGVTRLTRTGILLYKLTTPSGNTTDSPCCHVSYGSLPLSPPPSLSQKYPLMDARQRDHHQQTFCRAQQHLNILKLNATMLTAKQCRSHPHAQLCDAKSALNVLPLLILNFHLADCGLTLWKFTCVCLIQEPKHLSILRS